MLTRWFQGTLVFTDRDWRFLFGQPGEIVFTLKLWLKFVALWSAVVVVGFAVSFYVLPYGLIVHGCTALAHGGDFGSLRRNGCALEAMDQKSTGAPNSCTTRP